VKKKGKKLLERLPSFSLAFVVFQEESKEKVEMKEGKVKSGT